MKNEAILAGSRASASGRPLHTADYLRAIGVPDLAPRTSPFDPGYDPVTLASHLEQSGHLMSILKVSMACWQVAAESGLVLHPVAGALAGLPAERAFLDGIHPTVEGHLVLGRALHEILRGASAAGEGG